MDKTLEGEYKKAICPKCGKEINFSTKREIDYTQFNADSRVWCSYCNKWVKFSLKNGENQLRS